MKNEQLLPDFSNDQLKEIGRYIRSTDPDQFRHLAQIVGNQTRLDVGYWLARCDPEMANQILEND
jgi:hypothetical protein